MIKQLLQKVFMVTIALLMFGISVISWRYQGDIHHLHKKIFEQKVPLSQSEYQKIWQKYAHNNQTMKMQVIHLYEVPLRLWGVPKEIHPSEQIMEALIKSKAWNKLIPNSNSSTYPLSQKIWMSQNLSMEELINYYASLSLGVH